MDDGWMFRAIEAQKIEMQAKVDEANRRFQEDPVFHAKVYTAAKYLDAHVLPPEREQGDLSGRWADALMSAIAVTAVFGALESADSEDGRG